MFYNKIKYTLTRFFNKFSFERINVTDIFVNLFYLVVIVFLGMNIFTTFNKGIEDAKKFQTEQIKLQKLLDENKKLADELEQYSSIEYKKIYARENLNLAEKNETLYYVERRSDSQEIEKLPEDTIQINLEDNFYWWKKLILGI
jgi:cell division protein FtsB